MTFVATSNAVQVRFGVYGPKSVVDQSWDEIQLFEKTSNVAPTVSPSATPTSGAAPLTVQFQAGANDTDGAVAAAASSGVEPPLARCVDDVVTRLVFPPPRGGTLKIRYPFTFARAGGAASTAAASDYQESSAAPTSRARVTCGRRR